MKYIKKKIKYISFLSLNRLQGSKPAYNIHSSNTTFDEYHSSLILKAKLYFIS